MGRTEEERSDLCEVAGWRCRCVCYVLSCSGDAKNLRDAMDAWIAIVVAIVVAAALLLRVCWRVR